MPPSPSPFPSGHFACIKYLIKECSSAFGHNPRPGSLFDFRQNHKHRKVHQFISSRNNRGRGSCDPLVIFCEQMGGCVSIFLLLNVILC